MAIEIERKFLLANDHWRAATTARFHIRDGLTATENGRKVRVRIMDKTATITIKTSRSGSTRSEFEYAIPMRDAAELIDHHCEDRIIEKTRHIVSHDGFRWEIDEYAGILAGIIIAEIELQDDRTTFPRPDWLGREITGDESYRKINMLRRFQEQHRKP